MASIRLYMRVCLFSSVPPKARWNWTKLLAMEEKVKDQEALIEAEKKLREAENKYYNKAMERLGEKIGILQQDVLCLRNNFNLCGALEFSLDEYKNLYKIPEVGKTLLLQHLLKQQAYKACLMGVTECYQLQKKDINACAHTLYHELSKHAHGNMGELALVESEHTITEVAALEAVLCALKSEGCFRIPLKLYLKK
ncbi:hypothetical protein EDB89DRAFT_698405 [Lactarius sanguifluus]|nr:hypothetical protein EDB89DRAFT_698405 [Lactarius sanguifluus]